ncbi:MAG: TetR/AcrR family transcriptional regulator [Alphaproteobacteria bacterium]|jgi:TetR/AcrR family transcriptional repressor of nem operon|nr:TetR/AcrR family transcriptional regulator [Alphaproteobacteria bacterium]MDP6565579.1 TetR/AcrR family transcriptional regulator [Alphaproteobacteria bacterium]MDP6815669.1 TetR/AcrR family transcriptional regulator [Alphaproteobacteria bacterium]
MRYRPEHKDTTRRRILGKAGSLFRRHGYHGVGIDRIMAASRLTRGGFYGYFRSKADLLAQVLAGEHGFNAMMRRRTGDSRDELTAEALELVEGYLGLANRTTVGRGCMLAALSVDVARAGKPARRAYTERLRELAMEFARGLPDQDPARDDDPRALTAIALCVGGLTLARAVDDDDFAAAILASCRAATAGQLTNRITETVAAE